ncbi:MAG: 2-dehydropantoate 2-reductase N-terminal domain-containing protein, partial [Caldisphaera sp.]|nr:2-dehydropantoate 2-reductase N-terminal domain-containing protein [Caldisphaera sp.]
MKIAVIGGCGSVGSFISLLLSNIGIDVTVVDKRQLNCELKEISVINIGKSKLEVCGYDSLKNNYFDQIIFATKAYDV